MARCVEAAPRRIRVPDWAPTGRLRYGGHRSEPVPPGPHSGNRTLDPPYALLPRNSWEAPAAPWEAPADHPARPAVCRLVPAEPRTLPPVARAIPPEVPARAPVAPARAPVVPARA